MWWEHWFDNKTCEIVNDTVAKGLVKPVDGRLEVQTQMFINPYWLHVPGSLDSRNCALWYEIFFKRFGIIHSFCRYHCWKCVTKPRNVKELIQLRNLMYVVPFVYNFINPLPGKAGIDVREHTDSPYAAFNYATSLVEGLRIKEIMHYMVRTYLPNEKIDGKFLEDTIFVKRSCTEFEQKINGKDPWWNEPQTSGEISIERRLEEIYKCEPQLNMQPAWLCDKTVQRWLNFANSIGDKSGVDFIGSDSLTVHSVKYEAKTVSRKGGDEAAKGVKTKKRAKRKTTNKEKR